MKLNRAISVSILLSFVLISSLIITIFIENVREIGLEIPDQETTSVLSQDIESSLVTRVIDGDTIELMDGRKIRYIGIDTPEDPRSGNSECFALESSLKNQELVLGKQVRLEKDESDTDRFGRFLRYVYVDDVFVNYKMVREGYAFARKYPPDTKYHEEFELAETQARIENLGMWDKCHLKEDAMSINEIDKILQLLDQ